VRVVWISFAPLKKTETAVTSDLASARYRLILPATALQAAGWSSRVTYLSPQANQQTLVARFDACDAVVVGKILADRAQSPMIARRLTELFSVLQRRGIKIIADFCDDHFLNPQAGELYRNTARCADATVASTEGLADTLRQYTDRAVHTITDPVEGTRRDPQIRDLEARPASPADPVGLLWYGHSSNLSSLESGLRQLERIKHQFPISVTLVSLGPHAEALAAAVDRAWRSSGSRCRFIPWSCARVFTELQACDAVVIPSNPYDPHKAVKSPNRFTEAVWAGRLPLAHPVPAYEVLASYGWVGDDLAEGLLWYCLNPQAALQRIEAGQANIQKRFTPEAVGRSWMQVIEATITTR
jgi:hypothetical protein